MPFFRPFRAADLDGLYTVSKLTGHEGGDASHLYEDVRLVGHIYSAPYAILEPGFVRVVEDEDGIAGFAVGVPDTNAWSCRLEREWWPRLRERYTDPGPELSPDWSPDQRRAFTIHHPSPPPRWVSDPYPAHLNLNLAPRLQGQGWGARLLAEWLTMAGRAGVGAVHIGANPANQRAVAFWARNGFVRLRGPAVPSSRTVWMGRS